jgi:predicted RNA binding protein YcfA (HicA-like mRNA interferase family)
LAFLPVVSSVNAIRAFERCGWRVARRESSHITLVKAGSIVVLTVPERRELPRGTLRALIRLAGLTLAEFVEALDS